MDRTTVRSGYAFEDTYGYSRAVRAGDMVFVSGTTARDEALRGNAYEQTRASFAIVADALGQVGAALPDVVRTTVYVVDMADLEGVARAHREAFGAVRPASTVVQVAGLTPPRARVEVEVTAVTTGRVE